MLYVLLHAKLILRVSMPKAPLTRSDFKDANSWFRKFDRDVHTVRFRGSILVGALHLSRRVSDKNRNCSSSIRFSKLRIRLSEGQFYCVHTIRFSEPIKIRPLKSNYVNMP